MFKNRSKWQGDNVYLYGTPGSKPCVSQQAPSQVHRRGGWFGDDPELLPPWLVFPLSFVNMFLVSIKGLPYILQKLRLRLIWGRPTLTDNSTVICILMNQYQHLYYSNETYWCMCWQTLLSRVTAPLSGSVRSKPLSKSTQRQKPMIKSLAIWLKYLRTGRFFCSNSPTLWSTKQWFCPLFEINTTAGPQDEELGYSGQVFTYRNDLSCSESLATQVNSSHTERSSSPFENWHKSRKPWLTSQLFRWRFYILEDSFVLIYQMFDQWGVGPPSLSSPTHVSETHNQETALCIKQYILHILVIAPKNKGLVLGKLSEWKQNKLEA